MFRFALPKARLAQSLMIQRRKGFQKTPLSKELDNETV
jgi:hypothetical protein